MPLPSRLVLLPALLVVAALGTACRHSPPACAKPGIYAQAASVPPLRIPAGLDAPDTRGALKIPELADSAAPLPAGARCLDDPPRYAPNARLEPPPKAKGKARSAPEPAARRGRGETAPAAPAPTPAPASPPAGAPAEGTR